ncbi:hypothetical protein ANO14919_084120 [Xylariales sp. No.14919]|nr:hypothetical protein ANO14919_084120 [Xylariales sp. No.14919]
MSDKEASNASGAGDDPKFSSAEQKFFVTMFKYLPKNLDINWDQFAAEMGLKDGSIAKTRCRQIRTKYKFNEPSAGNGSGGTPEADTPKPINTTKGNKITKGRKPPKPKQQKKTPKLANVDDVDDGEA